MLRAAAHRLLRCCSHSVQYPFVVGRQIHRTQDESFFSEYLRGSKFRSSFAPLVPQKSSLLQLLESSHKSFVSWRRPSLSMDPPSPATLQLQLLMEQQLQVLQRMEQQQQTIIRLIRTQSNKRKRSQNGNSPFHVLLRNRVDQEHVVLVFW